MISGLNCAGVDISAENGTAVKFSCQKELVFCFSGIPVRITLLNVTQDLRTNNCDLDVFAVSVVQLCFRIIPQSIAVLTTN